MILPCVALVVLFKRIFGVVGGAREISNRRAALLAAVIGVLIGGFMLRLLVLIAALPITMVTPFVL